ncbi:hypothetical protein K9N50_00805 [bacterium]|nr:hypothetical protein [bacterium]
MTKEHCNIPEFKMEPTRLSAIADRYGLQIKGQDIEIIKIGSLSTKTAFLPQMLSYALTGQILRKIIDRGIGACIVHKDFKCDIPNNFTVLISEKNPEEVFYTIFSDSVIDDLWEKQQEKRGKGNVIASTAIIHDSVVIGNDCHIMDYAVILPNTRLGDRVVIEPHTTIGLDGLQTIKTDKHRKAVPHAGGLWVEDDVLIGASSVVRKALFGNHTYIGNEVKIGPLSSIGHVVVIGERSKIINTCMIAGGAVIGEGVRVAPSCSILQLVNLNDHSFIGLGSLVTRSIPAFALAYGSPAKVHGWVCVCERKLNFENDAAICEYCGRKYSMKDGVVSLVE